MASTACFVIVSKNDIPIYEAEVGSAPKKEDLAYQHQFILHAALDVVQDLAWSTNAMFLKSVDRFNDLVVSVYIFLNPLYLPGSRITSSHFDTKVRALARRYL
uniref:Trafficking protein particle complex subunit n=1 Tax=Leersia perrieri TaxID=77586 RepID=A0A0D9W6V1_9ORYZ